MKTDTKPGGCNAAGSGQTKSGRFYWPAILLMFLPVLGAQAAEPVFKTYSERLSMRDGVEIRVNYGGYVDSADDPLDGNKPFIAEFTPYGPDCCVTLAGQDFNYLVMHTRGTGDSDGPFDALGTDSQEDIAEVMAWACEQPWNNGRAGISGDSASAIAAYNALHLDMSCVEAIALRTGTHELYRDHHYPGGIPGIVPVAGVFAVTLAPSGPYIFDRGQRKPDSFLDLIASRGDLLLEWNQNYELSDWWAERHVRGNVNDAPILMATGFFDIEGRGPFEVFQDFDNPANHLLIAGGHEGETQGAPGFGTEAKRWFRHYLYNEDNGINEDPRVQIWAANGDRIALRNGDAVQAAGDDWPLPGTRWTTLYFDAERSGSSHAYNDGSLRLTPADSASIQPYVPVPTHIAMDHFHYAMLGPDADSFAGFTETETVEPLGLAYTSAPLDSDVLLSGPASLELVMTSSVIESDIYAVIADVWPDGSSHPMGLGRLRSSFPHIIEERSRRSEGVIVQPIGDFSAKSYVTPGDEHRYFVEFWPIGNNFKQGHRIRLVLIGVAATNEPGPIAPNLVRLGGQDGGSLLRLPVLPGNNLVKALGGEGPDEVAQSTRSADQGAGGSLAPTLLGLMFGLPGLMRMGRQRRCKDQYLGTE